MAAIEKNVYQSGSTVLYTDRLDFYISPQVVKKRYPLVSPFLTAVSNWSQIKPKGPQYKMFQYTSPWIKQYFQVTTGTTSAADNAEDTLAITSTGAQGMPATFTNHLLGLKLDVHANSGGKPSGVAKGQVFVTTFTSATSIKVKNLGTSSIVIANDDWLVVNGTAFGEGTEAANPSHDELSVVWGQTGIHKTSFQLTKTLMEAALRGESSEYNRLKIVNEQIHQIQKERDLLFSRNSIGGNLTGADTFGDGGRTDASGNVVRSTYGAFQAVLDYGETDTTSDNQNIFDINQATFKYGDLVDMSEKIFDLSPDGVLPLFTSDKLISFFNKVEGTPGTGITAKSGMQPTIPMMGGSKASRLGFNIKEWETPHGVIQFVRTPVMTKSPYNGYGFAVDPENIFHAVYRKPMYQQNIKTDNAPDYQKNQFMSDEGIGLTNLYNHTILRLV